jgi:hypothetical protein
MTAGGSAQAEYDRRRQRELAWQRDNRRRVVLTIVVTAVATYVGVLVAGALANQALRSLGSTTSTARSTSTAPAFSQGLIQLIAIVVAIGAAAELGQAAWGRRQTTEAWATGAAGERRTAELLAPLEKEGWIVLHDRRMPGSRANIDHVVVGPPGVFVVETKNYSGTVSIGRSSLRHNGRRVDAVIDQAQREAEAVRVALGPNPTTEAIPVRAVVCIHTARVEVGGWFVKSVLGGVRICSGRRLVAALTAAPPVLHASTIAQLGGALERSLPPAMSAKASVRTPDTAATAPGVCPCGGELALRRRRSDGRAFYGCSRYPSCRHTAPAAAMT